VIELQADVPLAPWSTMQVGGAAEWFVQARSEDEVLDALTWADMRRAPLIVLGGGSNVVVADRGIDGVVLQVAIAGVDSRDEDGLTVFSAGAGEPWDAFVERAVARLCAGIECLSGIPGLVGGTPVQNVGAYGQEVSETIRAVRVVDRRSRRVITMAAAECGFGYRTSRFKHADAGRYVVTGVEFALRRGAPPTIAYADVIGFFAGRPTPTLGQVRQAIVEIRSRKGMVIREGNPANRSCGSFFVNPVTTREQLRHLDDPPHYPVSDTHVKVPAAWLIERAGFTRGFTAGRVGISPFQAQGLINRGGASAAEVVGLALAIKRAVWKKFAIALVPEPVFLGFGHDRDLAWLLDPAPND
jgi:UDP-N-acetylmuramate dehydrogenase